MKRGGNMELLKIGERGQITLPKLVRKMILRGNKYVGLKVSSDGKITLIPVKVEAEEGDYTKEELKKIKKLFKEEGGKTYKTSKSAKKHIKSL
jgi:bifunctional DNA-binding transcriptional regulator/antitoxin component of YhaV-PrlF toxin-antitoxin module